MKILPNIKYDGMKFTCSKMPEIFILVYENNKYYVTIDKDMKTSAITNMEHIIKSLNDGFWKRIK